MTKQEQIRLRVIGLIRELGVGQAIPSERRLSTELGVSRLTLRAALDELVREGYLVRRHGSGTFVSEPKIAQQLTLTSFTEDMRRRGMVADALHLPRFALAGYDWGARASSLENVHAGPQVARGLNISPADRVFQIRRLRLADDEPMALETLHVPVSLVPGLTAAQLEHASWYELLEQRYNVVIASGLQTIEPTVTNEEESKLLHVPLHSPAFLFERTSQTPDGRTVEFVRSIYRGDRYRLVAELSQRREPSVTPLAAADRR